MIRLAVRYNKPLVVKGRTCETCDSFRVDDVSDCIMRMKASVKKECWHPVGCLMVGREEKL